MKYVSSPGLFVLLMYIYVYVFIFTQYIYLCVSIYFMDTNTQFSEILPIKKRYLRVS